MKASNALQALGLTATLLVSFTLRAQPIRPEVLYSFRTSASDEHPNELSLGRDGASGGATSGGSSNKHRTVSRITTGQALAPVEKHPVCDGLCVWSSNGTARLSCVFQRLEGEIAPEGLWLTSTGTDAVSDRFRLTAVSVGYAPGNPKSGRAEVCATKLPRTGTVELVDDQVRFVRPGLVEECSVSLDGVRQDFVVTKKPILLLNSRPSTFPSSSSGLHLELEVTGAKVEPAPYGAQLVLESSGRRIAYSRLHVVDATGKELAARMELTGRGALAIVVNDADAAYPVRIDPTFSDANWISMGGLPGVNGSVSAAVVDGTGNLYIGGTFQIVAGVFATNIAKWDGSSWSALGSGVNGVVNALVVSGTDLYAGGQFHDRGRDPGQRNCQMERKQLERPGLGARHSERLGGVGHRPLCGGQFPSGGR
jgi:hypothetical protein